ncbi:alpha/beta hydrolase [Marinicauda pacifica]|nr:alpha/beta hydrolase [Marinicauda pacifica]GGE43207.1 alpha/beta hydrolase [Marinicauda pacifica]
MKYILAGLAAALLSATAANAECGSEPVIFEARSGEQVEAWRGRLNVPEYRGDPGSRTLELGYICFRATGEQPGMPIVYLAGGPGGTGTGTARGDRFSLFMAMREFGDVIAFDQRGTGLSDSTEPCRSSIVLDPAAPISEDAYTRAYLDAVAECAARWREQGIDLRGYTTLESVHDLDALRVHLGAPKISLWGISYGSHLALAALEEMGDRIEAAILASAEGLDQTVKLPAHTNTYFGRLQAAIDAQPGARQRYGNARDLVMRVHAALDEEPILLTLASEAGDVDVLVRRADMQQIAGAMIGDPENAETLLDIYTALDAGIHEPLKGLMGYFFAPGEPITLRAMPTAMDRASGISAPRLEAFRAQAETSPIGAYLNFPMPQILPVLPELDLGEDFRTGPRSDVPVLLFSGTLDGRTYLEGQREAVAGLSQLTHIEVENAGHNLFMSTPEVAEIMAHFLRCEEIDTTRIAARRVPFTTP